MRKIKITLVLLLTLLKGFSQYDTFIPKSNCNTVVYRNSYAMGYSTKYNHAIWVSHKILPGEIKRIKQAFLVDPISDVRCYDFKRQKYERGHLCPDADIKNDSTYKKSTYYYGNISPQLCNFNKGVWKNKVEKEIREFSNNYEVYVVTGPVFKRNKLFRTGKHRIKVPGYYYKVVILKKENDYKFGFGLLVRHKRSSKKEFEDFLVPIDQIEELTGIDFFHELEDNIEIPLEENFKQRK
jgi:endonuclease G